MARAETALSALARSENHALDDLAPGTMVGEYELQEPIGQGGMATVYSAVHPLIGKRAAIKIMTSTLSAQPALVGRFIQEARAVNRIQHPNVVDVFSIGTLDDGRCYFVMEWLNGETLGDRLSKGPIPLVEAIDILDQIAEALQAAHSEKIWHRDLKPDNVFLVPLEDRISVKLLDFGIAKLAHPDKDPRSRTQTGMILGTPYYMAPEQARGHAVDGQADVYSLGALAFELLTGRTPFEADNAADLLVMHLAEPPPPPSSVADGIPRALDDLIPKMMAKGSTDRPTLEELRMVLADTYRSAVSERGIEPAQSSPHVSTLRRHIMTPVPKSADETPPLDSSIAAENDVAPVSGSDILPPDESDVAAVSDSDILPVSSDIPAGSNGDGRPTSEGGPPPGIDEDAPLFAGAVVVAPDDGLARAGDEEALLFAGANIVTNAMSARGKGRASASDQDQTLVFVPTLEEDLADFVPNAKPNRHRTVRWPLIVLALGLVAGAAIWFIPKARTGEPAPAEAAAGQPSPNAAGDATRDDRAHGDGKKTAARSRTPKQATTAPEPAVAAVADTERPQESATVAKPAATPKPPALGTLAVRTNVAARVVVDGKVRARKSRSTAVKLKAGGVHTVRVSAPRRETVTRKVRVVAGKTKVVKFFLKPNRKKKRRRR